MPFSNEDKALTNNLHKFKQYGPRRTMTQLDYRNCKSEGLDTLLKRSRKLKAPTKGMHGSVKQNHACTEENVTIVDELVARASTS